MNTVRHATVEKTPTYKIELPTFSGPLDLLLHLIDHNELDITVISLATVTDQYLAQIERLKDEKLEHLMDFLVVGARLLVIKSRALLPQIPGEFDEEDQEEDPAESLARQLRLYKRFKSAAGWLRLREENDLRTYLRVALPPRMDHVLDMTGITLASLEEALRAALDRELLRDESVSVATVRRVITIERQMALLRDRVAETGRVYFDELLSDRITWRDVSVTLLAVLELIKRNEVNVHQPEIFGPIEITVSQSNN